ncbi:hypothetical protein DTO271G3_384 [Paecilomyces variotii]|nr:hypothetical protein DTO271G3_384 [Paecilomyces variotii]
MVNKNWIEFNNAAATGQQEGFEEQKSHDMEQETRGKNVKEKEIRAESEREINIHVISEFVLVINGCALTRGKGSKSKDLYCHSK